MSIVPGSADQHSPQSVIERTLKPLDLGAPAESGHRPAGTVLDFTIQTQACENWCWAAVTASIGEFYSKGTKFTQCAVANEFLERTTCCSGGPGGTIPLECDRQAHLSQVLPNVCFCKRIPTSVPIAACLEQIAQGFPIGAHVTWPEGDTTSGHFVVIYGVDMDTNTLMIADPSPIQGRSEVPYDEFLKNYLHVASWDRTYYTKP